MSASAHRPLARVATDTMVAIVIAIAIGDIIKPTTQTKITAMEGELKVHSDTAVGVFSFEAMEKTFNDRIANASTIKFTAILQDPLYLDLLVNAKLFPYNSTTTHRCVVRNHSFVYGWCEEQQTGDTDWTRTHIVIYQPVMAIEQVIAAAASKTVSGSSVKTWVMAKLTPDTQKSYVDGHMTLGDIWVPGLAGLATRIPCDEDSADHMCATEVLLAAEGCGITSSIYQQIFVVRSKATGIAVLFIPQADSEVYASGTVLRYIFKVLLTPRFSLSPPACLDDPTKGSCFVTSFRRSSQENRIDVGNWRLAYWIQVTSFIGLVHLLTIGQTLGPVQRFIIIVRLPVFNVLVAQTALLAAQEFKVLMILRYGSGWIDDLVHRMLVLAYAYVVICSHGILYSREYSVSKGQYVMLGIAGLSAGVVIGATRWLSLPSATPNKIQSCYYCHSSSLCTTSTCCTANYLFEEIAAVVGIYLVWILVAVNTGAARTLRLKKLSNHSVVPCTPTRAKQVEVLNNFELECLNSEIVAEYRLHNVYRAIGDRYATTDLGLALTGYCATGNHLLRIDGVTFTSLALLLPKQLARHVPMTVTAWPLQRFEANNFQITKSWIGDDSNAVGRKLKPAGTAPVQKLELPEDVEPMIVTSSRRLHISKVNLEWGRVQRVYR